MLNYTLYGRSGTGSAVVEAILELLRLPYRVEHVPKLLKVTDGLQNAYVATINPLGQVPSLLLPDGTVLTESSAICVFLADEHPSAGLSPAVGATGRAAFLRWMTFLATVIYTSNRLIYHSQQFTTDPAGADAVKEAGQHALRRGWKIVDTALEEQDFLVARRLTACDLYASMLLSWGNGPEVAKECDNLRRLFARIAEIDVVAQVWKRNGIAI